MSQENVEIVKAGYGVWNEDDLDALLRLLDPDVETVFATGPDASVYRGHDGVRQWFREGLEAWDDWGTIEPREFLEYGDRVLVSVHWRVQGKGSGIQVEADQSHLVTLRDGQVTRMEFYADRESALQAAMSRGNVEVIRAAYDAWNRGDLNAVMERASRDVRLVQDRRIPGAVDMSGRDAVQAWLQSFYEIWDEFRIAPDRVEAVDDRVLVLATIHAKGRLSEAHLQQRIGHVLRLREGQIVDWRSYADPHDAVEAVGLPD